MNTLAYDLTSSEVSAGLLSGRKFSFRVNELTRSSEKLFGLVHELISENGLKPIDLDRVITFSGPGSFSGIRAGLAAAIAFQQSTNCQIMVFPSLLLACSGKDYGECTTYCKANREENFIGKYSINDGSEGFHKIEKLSEIEVVTNQDFEANNSLSPNLFNLDDMSSEDKLKAAFELSLVDKLPDMQVSISAKDSPPQPLYIKPVNAKTLAERGVTS